MPINILMPALSPTMTEGNLARWLKKEGDSVKSGQVIAEIETDKATMEVEAVDEGKIAKILVPAGTQGVAVNALIAILAEDGEDIAAITVPTAKDTAKQVAPAATAPKETKAIPAPMLAAPLAAAVPGRASAGGRILASPLARRVAEQVGVDLSRVQGSGPGGRIVKADITSAQESGGAGTSPASKRGGSMPAGIDARDLADKLGMAYEAVPNSAVRKVIAKRLTESKQTVPHFYLTIDCQIDQLLDLRKQMNMLDGVKISVNDFVIRAVALGMKKVPAANASWTDDAILIYKSVDVSIAVATPNGLITPIIKNTDTKTIAEISKQMKDLATRAREGKLRPEEFLGGGFTVSNLGMYGVKDFAAIINPPQACILAVGAGEQRPIVRDGQLAVGTVMSCTLSVDHRAVDGAVGAEFLQAFKTLIEQPYSLVI
ncbi:MAG: pyruvate dehydrogenase complex dihydrolipoamide acetyltransferase [Alphaproteobacteria bacterium]